MARQFDNREKMADLFFAISYYRRRRGMSQEQLAEELEGKAKVGKLNIDENMDIAEKYRVMNIPTFLIFKDGQEKERIVGAVSKNELKNKLEQALA